jgi:uncharacterized protein YgiM (DUF1202 family)
MAERRGSRMPSMETIVIVAFFLFFALWGISKCNDSRARARLAAEAKLSQRQRDSISRIAVQPIATQPVQPITTVTQPQNSIPVVENVPVPTPQNSRVITPNTVQQTQPQVAIAQPQPATTTVAQSSGQQLYVHESSLNVRTEPSLNAKSLGTLSFGAAVTYLSKTTDTQELSVGARTVDEPWFKIRTKRGTVGWVYGGYVKFYAPKK